MRVNCQFSYLDPMSHVQSSSYITSTTSCRHSFCHMGSNIGSFNGSFHMGKDFVVTMSSPIFTPSPITMLISV